MKKTCTTCGGSGQVGFFQGVSRFLLTWEECPQCCGTGYFGEEGEAGKESQHKDCGDNFNSRKKRKKTGKR